MRWKALWCRFFHQFKGRSRAACTYSGNQVTRTDDGTAGTGKLHFLDLDGSVVVRAHRPGSGLPAFNLPCQQQRVQYSPGLIGSLYRSIEQWRILA